MSTMHDIAAPVFFVERDGDLLSFRCPKCGKKHWHGAKGEPETPLRFYGHRMPHCMARDHYPNGYFLVGMDDPAELVGSVRDGSAAAAIE